MLYKPILKKISACDLVPAIYFTSSVKKSKSSRSGVHFFWQKNSCYMIEQHQLKKRASNLALEVSVMFKLCHTSPYKIIYLRSLYINIKNKRKGKCYCKILNNKETQGIYKRASVCHMAKQGSQCKEFTRKNLALSITELLQES